MRYPFALNTSWGRILKVCMSARISGLAKYSATLSLFAGGMMCFFASTTSVLPNSLFGTQWVSVKCVDVPASVIGRGLVSSSSSSSSSLCSSSSSSMAARGVLASSKDGHGGSTSLVLIAFADTNAEFARFSFNLLARSRKTLTMCSTNEWTRCSSSGLAIDGSATSPRRVEEQGISSCHASSFMRLSNTPTNAFAWVRASCALLSSSTVGMICRCVSTRTNEVMSMGSREI
mmetsp:Transcript_23902/g.57666  ORF Transcript_23902/g.57666 Transcript_23902/m.57666 type:complete len:232 (+) Transcript_23902:836-1531(+)